MKGKKKTTMYGTQGQSPTCSHAGRCVFTLGITSKCPSSMQAQIGPLLERTTKSVHEGKNQNTMLGMCNDPKACYFWDRWSTICNPGTLHTPPAKLERPRSIKAPHPPASSQPGEGNPSGRNSGKIPARYRIRTQDHQSLREESYQSETICNDPKACYFWDRWSTICNQGTLQDAWAKPYLQPCRLVSFDLGHHIQASLFHASSIWGLA